MFPQDVRASARMTRGAGTTYYQAPEVLNSTSYDVKVDVFSFGILFGEIVLKDLIGTGKPFVRDTFSTYAPPPCCFN